MMTERPFDCVELQHRGAALIYEETKGMTIAEELAYWQRCTAELRQQQQARWQAQKMAGTTDTLDYN
jgi:hypothetical protein